MKYKDRVDKAVEIIKGYCLKHTNCEKCRFRGENGYCMFEGGDVPCDWSDTE